MDHLLRSPHVWYASALLHYYVRAGATDQWAGPALQEATHLAVCRWVIQFHLHSHPQHRREGDFGPVCYRLWCPQAAPFSALHADQQDPRLNWAFTVLLEGKQGDGLNYRVGEVNFANIVGSARLLLHLARGWLVLRKQGGNELDEHCWLHWPQGLLFGVILLYQRDNVHRWLRRSAPHKYHFTYNYRCGWEDLHNLLHVPVHLSAFLQCEHHRHATDLA